MRFDPVTWLLPSKIHPCEVCFASLILPAPRKAPGPVGWLWYFLFKFQALWIRESVEGNFGWHKWSTLTLFGRTRKLKSSGRKVWVNRFFDQWNNQMNQLPQSNNLIMESNIEDLNLEPYFSSHHHSGPQNWISSSWMIHRELPMPRIPARNKACC